MKLWPRQTPPQAPSQHEADVGSRSESVSGLQQAFRLLKRPPRPVSADSLDSRPPGVVVPAQPAHAGRRAFGRAGALDVEDVTPVSVVSDAPGQEPSVQQQPEDLPCPPEPIAEHGPQSTENRAKGLGLRFKRAAQGTEAAAPEREGQAPGALPVSHAGSGWAGRLKAMVHRPARPPQAPPSERPASGPEPRSAGAKRAAPRAADSQQFLCTELTAGVQAFWRLTAEGLEPATQEGVASALSVTAQDHRFASSARLRYSGAAAVAQAETGEVVSVVNLSGGALGAVYATPLERAQESTWAIKPAAAALSALLADKLADRTNSAAATSDMIVGFDLKLRESDNRLVILYRLTSDNDLVDVQVSANVDDLQFALRQFAAIRRIDPALAEVVLFSAEELAQASLRVAAFSAEAVWQGVPVRKVTAVACAISVALATAAAGAAAWEYVEFARASAEVARLDAAIQDKSSAVAGSIAAAPSSFARQDGVDIAGALAGAQALWLPGTTLVMDAQASQGVRYEVRMPLVQGTNSGGRTGLAGALTPERLSGLIDLVAPQGCSRDGTYITANLNEVQVIITCQGARSPLAGYRLD